MTFFLMLFLILFFGVLFNRLAKLIKIPSLVFYLLFGILLSFIDSKVFLPSSRHWIDEHFILYQKNRFDYHFIESRIVSFNQRFEESRKTCYHDVLCTSLC